MDLINLLSNPVRMQIMQYLQIHGEATTKQISEALTDISTPTLYRHINALLKEELLTVVEERKVRGSLERLLTVNRDKFVQAEDGNIADVAYQFLMELYIRFQKYSAKPTADPRRDQLSMRTCMLRLTDADFDGFMRDIAAVMEKYEKIPEKSGTKRRSVSFISAPVEEEQL